MTSCLQSPIRGITVRRTASKPVISGVSRSPTRRCASLCAGSACSLLVPSSPMPTRSRKDKVLTVGTEYRRRRRFRDSHYVPRSIRSPASEPEREAHRQANHDVADPKIARLKEATSPSARGRPVRRVCRRPPRRSVGGIRPVDHLDHLPVSEHTQVGHRLTRFTADGRRSHNDHHPSACSISRPGQIRERLRGRVGIERSPDLFGGVEVETQEIAGIRVSSSVRWSVDLGSLAVPGSHDWTWAGPESPTP